MATTTLQPAEAASKDCYVEDGSFTYNSAELDVAEGYTHAEAYVQFDLTGITGTVTSATFSLYKTGGSQQDSGGQRGGGSVYPITSTWAETTVTSVTWSTAYSASQSFAVDYGWVDWDVTSIVNAWINSGLANRGFIVLGDIGVDYYTNLFASSAYSDSTKRPKLVVTTGVAGQNYTKTVGQASVTPTGGADTRTYIPRTPQTYTKTVGSASIQPVGVTKKQTQRKMGAANVTPTGVAKKLITRTSKMGAASITPSGALIKLPNKKVGAANVTPTGTITKQTSHKVTGSVTPTGGLNPNPPDKIAGSGNPLPVCTSVTGVALAKSYFKINGTSDVDITSVDWLMADTVYATQADITNAFASISKKGTISGADINNTNHTWAHTYDRTLASTMSSSLTYYPYARVTSADGTSAWLMGASFSVPSATYAHENGGAVITPTGTLIRNKQAKRTVGQASVTPTGLVKKTTLRKTGQASLTPTALVKKLTSKKMGQASLTPTALVKKMTTRTLGGAAVTPVGSLPGQLKMLARNVGGASVQPTGSLTAKLTARRTVGQGSITPTSNLWFPDPGDTYANWAHLSRWEVEDVDFNRQSIDVSGSKIGVIGIHGGGIEPGTSEIVKEIAKWHADGKEYDMYLFEGIKSSGNSILHVTATHFDEPWALDIVNYTDYTVSIHGTSGSTPSVFIGGLDTGLRDKISANLTAAGFTVKTAPESIDADDTRNIVNKNRRGKGVQLELTLALRQSMFGTFTAAGRSTSQNATFYAFTDAIRAALAVANDRTVGQAVVTPTGSLTRKISARRTLGQGSVTPRGTLNTVKLSPPYVLAAGSTVVFVSDGDKWIKLNA